MSILIKNALILTQNAKRERFFGDVYIEDQRIVQISKKPLSFEADYKIDGKHKWVLPGLINTHTHIPMTLLRGYGDDMILKQWLENRIWPVEAKLGSASVETGTKLGLLEMISSGTTTFSDMYFFEDTIGETTEKAGVRACLGFPMVDFGMPKYPADELFSECERFLRRWAKNPLITPVIGPHGTYTCGPEILQKTCELSEKYDSMVQIHCSETREEVYDVEKRYGVRPVEQLKKYGLLNDKTLLAHCGWITKSEITDIKTGGASVSHCPVSNMKMATGGYTPVPELLDAGVSVGLGTDGAASHRFRILFLILFTQRLVAMCVRQLCMVFR
ncbi:MAG: amidohydrolase [Euryarchaeota archaeon]|nr:amidohydrolase [Euryarchaeota archaeon]